jgi:hypothetical protein
MALSPLGTKASTVQASDDDDDDDDDDDRWAWTSSRNQKLQKKPRNRVPLCPPRISHDLTWDRSRAAAVEIRWLTAWLASVYESSCGAATSTAHGRTRAAARLSDSDSDPSFRITRLGGSVCFANTNCGTLRQHRLEVRTSWKLVFHSLLLVSSAGTSVNKNANNKQLIHSLMALQPFVWPLVSSSVS